VPDVVKLWFVCVFERDLLLFLYGGGMFRALGLVRNPAIFRTHEAARIGTGSIRPRPCENPRDWCPSGTAPHKVLRIALLARSSHYFDSISLSAPPWSLHPISPRASFHTVWTQSRRRRLTTHERPLTDLLRTPETHPCVRRSRGSMRYKGGYPHLKSLSSVA